MGRHPQLRNRERLTASGRSACSASAVVISVFALDLGDIEAGRQPLGHGWIAGRFARPG
jgi:hypothetical protein